MFYRIAFIRLEINFNREAFCDKTDSVYNLDPLWISVGGTR
jgi:hypothetical protein